MKVGVLRDGHEQVQALGEAEPDVLLVDHLERSALAVNVVRQIKSGHPAVVVKPSAPCR